MKMPLKRTFKNVFFVGIYAAWPGPLSTSIHFLFIVYISVLLFSLIFMLKIFNFTEMNADLNFVYTYFVTIKLPRILIIEDKNSL